MRYVFLRTSDQLLIFFFLDVNVIKAESLLELPSITYRKQIGFIHHFTQS